MEKRRKRSQVAGPKAYTDELLARLKPRSKGEPSIQIDVTPSDLIDGGRRIPGLRDVLDEIDQQWPQGRDTRGNGHGTRIGTVEVYFDTEQALHIHFSERGAYLERTGGLKRVPIGHMSSYLIAPQFNVSETPAYEVGRRLVSLPNHVRADDERWNEIDKILKSMARVTSAKE